MARYQPEYITPKRVFDELPDSNQTTFTDSVAHYNLLWDAAKAASAYLTSEIGYVFTPYQEAVTQEYTFRRLQRDNRLLRDTYGNWILIFHDSLLSLTSLSWNGTSVTSDNYELVNSNGSAIIDELVIDANLALQTSTTFKTGLTVTALWGYHEYYSNAWAEVEDSITVADASTATITVAAASAYETREYIRIEDEIMQITARNESTQVLTVTRGARGTTAAAHSNQAIERYTAMDDIRTATVRLAAYLYERRSPTGILQIGDNSVLLDQMPTIVKTTINQYRKLHMGSV